MCKQSCLVLCCAIVLFIFQFLVIVKCIDVQSRKPADQPSQIERTTLEIFNVSQMVTNINFSVSHAQRANVNEVNKERDEKIASFFKNIERRLIERKPQMKSIHQALQQLSSIGGYAHDEEEIMHSLRTCQRYQNDPRDNYLQKKFFDQASTLPKHLENLLDGLLGQRLLNADIMAILSDANQCRDRKLQEQMAAFFLVVETGLGVYEVYQEMRNTSTPSRESFRNFVIESAEKMSERLNEMVMKCQIDEDDIQTKMIDIIEKAKLLHHNIGSIAEEILLYLETKYDNKLWTVVVITESSDREPKYILSGGFYQVRAKGTIAAAVAVERIDADRLFNQTTSLMKHFKFFPVFPLNYNTPKWTPGVYQVRRYLDNYLTTIRSKVMTESLVIHLNSTWTSVLEKNVTMSASAGAPNIHLPFNQHSTHYMTMVVPVTDSTDSSARNSVNKSKCVNYINRKRNVLRNKHFNMFLSVENDGGALPSRVRLEIDFKNKPSQIWRFVDNTLRNSQGKCLTVYKNDSNLWSDDCDKNETEQRWYRNGSQIVNGNGRCLEASHKYDDNFYQREFIKEGECRDTPSFQWDDWDLDCHPNTGPEIIENYTPLTNDFGLYLSVSEEENIPYLREWSNQSLGYYWQLVDGKLKNQFGNCLVNVETRNSPVELIDCDQVDHQSWTVNHKRQIVYGKRCCLTQIDPWWGKLACRNCKGDGYDQWTFYQ